MPLKIEKAAVVGGGIMGSGIAALFANQGIPVTMFDVNVDAARKSLEKLASAKKIPQLTSPRNARFITAASVDQYADLLGDADAIVEVVPEILSLKQKVFAAVDEHRKKGSIVATNTSGLSIAKMCEGRSDDFRAHFLGTHYFYPVRYMALVELIAGPDTDAGVLKDYADFFRGIGKKPVTGRDTPNFIANRIGVYSMLKVMRLAEKYRLDIETVDMITGSPIGHPKSASYRLADMVGLDTLLHVTTNSYENCPDDEVRDELQPPALLAKMVEAGRLGQKTGEGFYKKAGKGKILVLDPETFEYSPIRKPRADRVRVAKGYPNPADRVRVMCTGGDDPISAFARELVLATGAYSLNRLGEVAGDVLTIDNALKWGFGRDIGPIEALDAIGLERAASMMEDLRMPVPAALTKAIETTGSFYSSDAVGRTQFLVPDTGAFETAADDPSELSLTQLKRSGKILRENLNARLVDMGDGVLLCELDAKMVPALNPVDDYIMSMLERAYAECESGRFKALVIGNQAKNFCAGANLKAVLELAQAERFDMIEDMTRKLQDVNMRNLHAPFPVITAPHGMTLGGGLEIALGGQVRVLLSELYCGLVEVGVGLIPAGAGCLRLLQLHQEKRNTRGRPLGAMQNTLAVFDLIGFGRVSSSADDARGKFLVPRSDVICFSKEAQLKKAKEVALARLDGFEAIPETPVLLPGRSGYLVMEGTIDGMRRAKQISSHAAKIAKIQANILTGGPDASPVEPVSEERILQLEREAFVQLVKESKTQERMAYMLKKGKPLFN